MRISSGEANLYFAGLALSEENYTEAYEYIQKAESDIDILKEEYVVIMLELQLDYVSAQYYIMTGNDMLAAKAILGLSNMNNEALNYKSKTYSFVPYIVKSMVENLKELYY